MLAFDPNKSFFEQALLRVTVGLIVLFSGIVSFVIWFNTPLGFDWSSDGFNYFLGVYKFPLGVLALNIPVVAVLAANHRSVQTSAQILASERQNLFVNYYKHLEEFSDYVLEHKDSLSMVSGLNVRHVHRHVFTGSEFGDYAVDEIVRLKVDNLARQTHGLLIDMCAGGLVAEYVIALDDYVSAAGHSIGLTFDGHRGRKVTVRGKGRVVPSTYSQFFSWIKSSWKGIVICLEFDTSYAQSDAVRDLLGIKISAIPNDPIREDVPLPPFKLV